MNKTHRSVWNAKKQTYVAAAESVSAKGKPCSGTKVVAALSALFGGLLTLGAAQAQTPPPAAALPTGGQVSAGQASIGQSGAHMVIQQGSDRAAINWQTFNVGKDAHVQFNQPSAASVTLNRVMSADPSQIFGRISANGQVVLTNPAGVYFGRSARVDVGGLVATTNSIGDADFMAGKSRYERQGSTGSVVNEGELKAALGGYIALLAPEVRNQGAVIAQMGTVALAAGEAVDLHFDSNNRLTSIRVEPAQIQTLVDNRHAVQAPGGLVILSARSLDRLLGGVVKNSGRIEANGLQKQGGRIVLSASQKVDNSGVIEANANAAANAQDSGPAGRIEIAAPEVHNSGSISANGAGSYAGGSVKIEAERFIQTDGGSVRTDAPTRAGEIAVVASQQAYIQGALSAASTGPAPLTLGAAAPAGDASAPVASDAAAPTADSAPTEASAGGQIEVQAGQISLGGAVDASGGRGGVVRLHAAGTPVAPEQPSDPRAPGRLAILGGSSITVRGRSGQGGQALLTGDNITLDSGTHIDATGSTGGGAVLVGGDWQGGANAERRVLNDPHALHQATTVTLAQGATIDASATDKGKGGTVVLWSDIRNPYSVTTASGAIYAMGGAQGGDGGQIETSGGLLVTEGVSGSAAAVHGTAGEWLFDPTNVTIGTSGTASAQNNGTSISASSIASLLNGGTSVTVTTFNSGGGDLGDLTVNTALQKSSGNGDVTLTLRAANAIVVNQAIQHTGGSGKLNLVIDADNNTAATTAGTAPVRDGGGVIILEANLSTGGGNVTFGGTAAGAGGVFTGGDLFVGGTNAITITTGGGAVDVKGNLIIANSSSEGFAINTAGGTIDLRKAVDSGNRYQSIGGQRTWEQARDHARTQGGWLATIGSSLENALATRAANYQGAWLGGERIIGTNEWRWTQDPAYNADTNRMVFFYQGATSQTSLGGAASGSGGTTATGYFANWGGWTDGFTGGSEPNNWGSAGSGNAPQPFSIDSESVLQFVGEQGNWNDLPRNITNSGLQQYVLETDLAPSRLQLNAGTGAVNIGAGVGFSKALSQVNVTASNTSVTGSGIITTGVQSYSSGVNVSNAGRIEVSGSTVTFNGNFNATATGDAGASRDVFLNAAFVNLASTAATFAVESPRHIQLGTTSSITANNAAMNTTLWADTDRSGDGIVYFAGSGITTNGGGLTFGKAGQNTTVGGSTVLVGGDVFFQRGSAQTLSTGGGAVNIYGETIVANTAGLNINSGNGNVTLHGLLNSGNSYAFVGTADNATWTSARTAAKGSTGGGGAVNDTYLVTIASRLENSIAGLTANYRSAWIGAYRDTDNVNGGGDTRWYWAGGPEAQTYFYNQSDRSTVAGYYSLFGNGEPNGTGASGESYGQFFGSAGLWNDLGNTGGGGNEYTVKGYIRETNLAPSPVTINAGTGDVTLSGAVGTSKNLASLTVTGGVANINGGAVATQGAQTYNAPVVLGAHTTLTTRQSDMVFNSTVNSAAGTNWNLTTNITPNTTYYWVDWTSATANSVTGRIVINGETINVTYANSNGFAFAQTSSGTNYWTGYIGAGFSGSSPYVSTLVANGPTGVDMIALQYAGSQTLTFSQPVENLAFSIISMNGNGYAFNQDFDIVSYAGFNGAGPGYYGGGNMTKAVVGNTYQLNDGGVNSSSVNGWSEPHGTIRFNKAFNELTWQSLSQENWNGFTVGITGTSDNAGAVRFNGAVGGVHALGNMAVNAQLVTSNNTGHNAALNANSLAVTGLATLGNNITTVGNQTFGSAVTLSSDVQLQTTANGNVSSSGTASINGAHALSIETQGSGLVSLGSAVGAQTPLSALTVSTNQFSTQDIHIAQAGALSITNAGAGHIWGNLHQVGAGTGVTLSKDGAGRLNIIGSNSFGGNTTVDGGTLAIYTNGGLGGGDVTLAEGTGLLLGRTVTTVDNDIALTGDATIGLDADVDYLVVAGGGGGGSSFDGAGGGGGGAGGLLAGTTALSGAASLTVTVGAGGASGVTGSNSVLADLQAFGGGGGGHHRANGLAGGSGGGAGSRYLDTRLGGSGVAGQGNAGGINTAGQDASGGGGAGAGGGSGNRAGGAGLTSSITGSAVTYASGGEGGVFGDRLGTVTGTAAQGYGSGGGGASAAFSSGAATNGAVGNSGIVVVRYLGAAAAGGSGGTIASGTGSANGYTLHTFTSAGSTALNLGGLNAVLSGEISGTGALTVNAAQGRITLASDNSYTGTTTIAAGELRVGQAGTTGSVSTANIINNGALVLNRSDDISWAQTISGTGSLTKLLGNTLTLTGNNSYSGTTTIGGGTLQVGTGGTTGAVGTGAITNNGALVFDRSNDVTVGGVISGTGSLTQEGAGTLTLTANSTYTGANTISDGTLVLSNNAPNPTNKTFGGTGQLRIVPTNAAFAGAFSSSGWTFANTLSGLTIGKPTNTANITINNALTIAGPISVYGGAIGVNANFDTTAGGADGDVLLRGSKIAQAAGVTVLTQGGDITYEVNESPWTAANDIGIDILGASASRAVINAQGGHISLKSTFASAGNNNAAASNHDLAIRVTDADIRTEGAGRIEIDGDVYNNASSTGDYIWGVDLRTGTVIRSEAGNISITGKGGSTLGNSRGIVSNNTNLQVLSDSGVIALTDLVPEGNTSYNGMYFRASSANAITFGADGTLVETSSSDVRFLGNRVTFELGDSHISTSGQVTVAPVGSSFGSDFSTASLNIDATVSELVLGKTGNTSNITLARAASVAGPITVHGNDIAINAALSATDGATPTPTLSNVNIFASGAVTQTAPITANRLTMYGGGSFTLTHPDNSVSTLFGGMTVARLGSLSFTNAGALTVGVLNISSIAVTGDVHIATRTGDLTLDGFINTLSASSSAVVLNAGSLKGVADSDFYDGAGGNIIRRGADALNPEIVAGNGGRIKLYTGSIADSTGLVTAATGNVYALIQRGTGVFRYASDETTTNYTAPLSSGMYVIYRERPQIDVSPQEQTITYGNNPVLSTAGDGSTVNGDTLAQALPTAPGAEVYNSANDALASVNGTGYFNAGSYTLRVGTLAASALGYAVDATGTSALTVAQKALTVTANNAAKFYSQTDPSGYAGVSLTGLVAGETGTGNTYTLTRAGAGVDPDNANALVTGEASGVYALTPALTNGETANPNYTVDYSTGSFTIVPVQQALIRTGTASPASEVTSVVYGTEAQPVVTRSTFVTAPNSVTVASGDAGEFEAGDDITLLDGDDASIGTARVLRNTAGVLEIETSVDFSAVQSVQRGSATAVATTAHNVLQELSLAAVNVDRVVVEDDTQFAVGDLVSQGASTGVVRRIDASSKALTIEVTAGTFSAIGALDNTSQVNNTSNITDQNALSGTYAFRDANDLIMTLGIDADGRNTTTQRFDVGSYGLEAQGAVFDTGMAVQGVKAVGTLTVTPLQLSLAATKVYDGNAAFSGTITTGVGTETLTFSNAQANSAHVLDATHFDALVLTDGAHGGLASNYQLPTLGVASGDNAVTITRRALTVSASKVYDGSTEVSAVLMLGNVVDGEALAVSSATSSNARVAQSDKFISAVTFADATGRVSNYSLQGQTLVSGTALNSGLSAEAGVNAVTISARELQVSLGNSDVSKVYDGTTNGLVGDGVAANAAFVPQFVVANGLAGDSFVFDYTATYDSPDVVNATAINLTGLTFHADQGLTSASLASATSDYTFNTTTSVAASITPRALAVSGTGVSKVYDGTTGMGNVTVGLVAIAGRAESGLVGDESLTVSGGVGAFDASNAGTGIGYSLTSTADNLLEITAGTGTLASNYSIPGGGVGTITGNDGVIYRRPLAVSFAGDTKVYDGTTDATVTVSYAEPAYAPVVLNGLTDDVQIGRTAVFDSKNVGTGSDRVTVSNVSLSGSAADNYTLSYDASNPLHSPTVGSQAGFNTEASGEITQRDSVTWVGGASGDWFNPANWALTSNLAVTGVVPDLANVLTVVIPTGSTVNFSDSGSGLAVANQPVSIAGLQAAGATLNLIAGSLNVGDAGATMAVLSQSAGAMGSSGTVSVTDSFSQSAGTLSTNGATAHLSITQLTGNLGWISLQVGGNLTLSSVGQVAFGSTTVGGDLVVSTAGAATAGGVVQSSGSLVVSGTSTFTANTGVDQVAALTTATNDFGGAVSFVGASGGSWQSVALVDGVGGLTLGNIQTTGALTVTSTDGDINQDSDAVLTIGGEVTLLASNGADPAVLYDITLDGANNDFQGQVNATGKDITLVDGNGGLILGDISATGDLDATSTDGAISQADGSAIEIAGDATFEASEMVDGQRQSRDITLDGAANDFGGTVNADGANITLVDGNGGLILGDISASGDLDATSTDGAISQADGSAIEIAGDATFEASEMVDGQRQSRDITLDGAANDFGGTVNADGANITLVDGNGGLTLGDISASGDLDATSTDGAITQADGSAIEIAGDATFEASEMVDGQRQSRDITLDGAANDFGGTVNADGANIALVDGNGGLTLGDISATGDLDATSTDGAITQADGSAIEIAGDATFEASEMVDGQRQSRDITLDGAANDFGGTVNADGANITLVDGNGGLILGDISASGDLDATSTDGAISQADGSAIEIAGDATFEASEMVDGQRQNRDITLDGAANDFGGTVNADGANITLVDVNGLELGNITATGSLDATAATDITVSGDVAAADMELDAGRDLVVNGSLTGDNLTLDAGNNVVINGGVTADNFSAVAGGDISQGQSSRLAVAGTTDLSAQGDIRLDSPLNDFVGVVNAGGQNITIRDANALTLGTVTADGDLLLASVGPMSLGITSVAGDLDVNSGNGDITQTGPLSVAGLSRVVAGAGSADLNNPGNQLPKGVTVQAARYTLAGDGRRAVAQAQAKVQGSLPVMDAPGTATSNASLPPPLAMGAVSTGVVPAAAGSASGGGDTGGGSAVAAAGADGVSIDVRFGSGDTTLMASVALPRGTSTIGTGFSFELPPAVRDLAVSGASVEPRLLDGSPLPAWLRFDAQAMRFESNAVPTGAFPLQVQMKLAGQMVIVVISERSE